MLKRTPRSSRLRRILLSTANATRRQRPPSGQPTVGNRLVVPCHHRRPPHHRDKRRRSHHSSLAEKIRLLTSSRFRCQSNPPSNPSQVDFATVAERPNAKFSRIRKLHGRTRALDLIGA